jgi:protein-S-isoprenylcysteine O-methyltransferase Ste14
MREADMANAGQDRPSPLPWPPIIYAAALIACWILEASITLPRLPESLIVRWIGAVVFLAGLGLGLKGFADLRAAGTTMHPTDTASALVTDGIYARTRNPLYLAALIAFVGLGLALRSTWLLIAVPGVAIALTRLAIEPEEAYLARRFGAAYLNYTSRVRRWI